MNTKDKQLLIEKVEKMRKSLTEDKYHNIFLIGYSEALNDVITLIQGMETEE